MTRWPDTRESLILMIRDPRDAVAWEQFLAIYHPIVLRLIRRRGLQHADAEDIAQQVFTAVATAVERWEYQQNGPRFRNWLGRVARNATLNAITRNYPDVGSGKSSVQQLLAELPADDALAHEFIRQSRIEALRWAASKVRDEFSDSTWQMFRESTVEGEPVADVAQRMGRTVGAVYIAKCRVMKRIKEMVTDVSDFWSVE
jgi:RNA polymerase sigma-70 factor, ECF subfamily